MKNKAFIKIISLILSLIACVTAFAACGGNGDQIEQTTVTEDVTTENYTQDTTVEETLPEAIEYDHYHIKKVSPESDEVCLVNADINEWFFASRLNTKNYYDKGDNYAPVPVVLEWTCDEPALYYNVRLSKKQDMSDAMAFVTDKTVISVNDLEVDTAYYWQVSAITENEIIKSTVFGFRTLATPRTLDIDGVTNTRDIGGITTGDGKRIKQGLVFRGSELNDVTEAGKHKLLVDLGLKTDLDLRGPVTGEKAAPLGDAVNHIVVTSQYYSAAVKPENFEVLAQAIRAFGNPDNYPIYVHCSLGRDRTGTVICVIETLLGYSQRQINVDYELSFFSAVGCMDKAGVSTMQNQFKTVYNFLRKYSDGTPAENTEKFLLDIGITQEEIQTIKDMMWEDAQ